jgi:ADP-ribosylglycohydrolase
MPQGGGGEIVTDEPGLMLSAETLASLAQEELVQLEQEGREVAHLRPLLAEAHGLPPREQRAALARFFAAAAEAPLRPDWPYHEPSSWEEIQAARPAVPSPAWPLPSATVREDRLLGAWLGRCAGCMLGKPVEGRTQAEIEALLRAAHAWELDYYFPPLSCPPPGLSYPPPTSPLLRGNITRAIRDDDTDYTLLGLHILEENGPDFRPLDVARQWLDHLPYHRVYTAERMAYRNFVAEIWPPHSAVVINPYREWIGAQIRADAWGYAAPGCPEKAAELAWRDACVSHTKNGIYGAMFFAALIAAALATGDLQQALAAAQAQIPARCRFREVVEDCLQWCESDADWQQTYQRVATKYGRYHPVHTLNNAALVLMGLLHSHGEFGRAICLAVMGGWDTDCNGATAGSVMGALLGASRLPEQWVLPLHDTLESALEGMNVNRISDLAQRTLRVAVH